MKTHMADARQKVTGRERITYWTGSSGFVYAYIMFTSLILYYFTDILGISGAAAGTLLLIARVWDGINDPMMGALIDRTNTRIGKTRPYILCGGILLSVFTVLLFTVPGFSGGGAKLAWAYFTYIGFGMAYTVFITASKVQLSRLTQDRNEITTLNSGTFVGTSIVSILAAATMMPFISYFAGAEGNMARGYRYTSLIAATLLLATAMLLFTVKERDFDALDSEAGRKKSSLVKSVKAVFQNSHFMGFCACSAIVYFGYYLSAATVMYYCIYNLGSADYYTPITVINYGAPIVAALTMPYVVKRFEKRTICLFSIIILGAAYGMRFLTGDKLMSTLLIFSTIGGIASGYWNILFTPMSLDCAAYSSLKTGLKVDGLFVSSFTLLTKVSSGIAGAFLGFLLDHVGYVQNAATQSATVLTTLRLCATLGMTIAAAAGAVIIFFTYKITGKTLDEMKMAAAQPQSPPVADTGLSAT